MSTGIIQKNSAMLIELSQFARQTIKNSFQLRNRQIVTSYLYHFVFISHGFD